MRVRFFCASFFLFLRLTTNYLSMRNLCVNYDRWFMPISGLTPSLLFLNMVLKMSGDTLVCKEKQIKNKEVFV